MNEYGTLMSGLSLAGRNISAFPLSVGTSLALESLFAPKLPPWDAQRPIPNIVKVSDYQEMWFNLGTMFRNVVGAVNKEVFMHSNEHELKDTLLQEIEVIDSLFQNEGNGLCKPVYYYCTYKGLATKYPPAIKLRQDKTEGQKFYSYKLEKTMELLTKQTDDIREYDYGLKPSKRNDSLIMTHVPYDLLSFKDFNKLDLLESNTGKLKKKHQWNSKYYPVPETDMSMLPFTRKLLLVLGDKSTFHAMDMKLRKTILKTAHDRQWTPMTTDAKVIMDLSLDIREPFVVDFLQKL